MKKVLSEIGLTSLGLAVLGYHGIEDAIHTGKNRFDLFTTFASYVREGIVELYKEVVVQRDLMEARIDDTILNALKDSDIPSQEELQKIYNKMNELSQKIRILVTP